MTKTVNEIVSEKICEKIKMAIKNEIVNISWGNPSFCVNLKIGSNMII